MSERTSLVGGILCFLAAILLSLLSPERASGEPADLRQVAEWGSLLDNEPGKPFSSHTGIPRRRCGPAASPGPA